MNYSIVYLGVTQFLPLLAAVAGPDRFSGNLEGVVEVAEDDTF